MALRGPGRRCTRCLRLAALLLLAFLGCRSRAFMGLPFERPAPAVESAESAESVADFAQSVVLGSAYASSYLLKDQMDRNLQAALPIFDQMGLVLLFAATLVAVGVYIKLNLWGEVEMKYSKERAAWAMRIPMEQSAKAEGAAEQVSAIVTGFFFALIAGLTSFTVGFLSDLIVELLPILALLVPLGLALGAWMISASWLPSAGAWAPLGRAAFFLGLYGLCSLLRFMRSYSEDAD